MFFKPRTVPISLKFEDRTYKLGDTIEVVVELKPTHKVEVRGGMVELVLEEKFTKTETVRTMGMGGSASMQGGVVTRSNDYLAATPTTTSKIEKSVRSTGSLVGTTVIDAGQSYSYTVKVPIGISEPKHLQDAKELEQDSTQSWSFTWKLVATVDVPRGKDAKAEAVVKVRVGS